MTQKLDILDEEKNLLVRLHGFRATSPADHGDQALH